MRLLSKALPFPPPSGNPLSRRPLCDALDLHRGDRVFDALPCEGTHTPSNWNATDNGARRIVRCLAGQRRRAKVVIYVLSALCAFIILVAPFQLARALRRGDRRRAYTLFIGPCAAVLLLASLWIPRVPANPPVDQVAGHARRDSLSPSKWTRYCHVGNGRGAIEPVIRRSTPGRYHVDQIERDPLPGGHTSRRRGVDVKRHGRSVMIELDPWDR